MYVYKIEKKKYKNTYPPRGSLFANGRWNTKDMWIVYTSENIALTKLEALANSGSQIPENRFLLTMEVSENAPLVEITVNDLPSNWSAVPYPRELSRMIKSIIDTGKFIGIIVPSVQSPQEKNIILLPSHPGFNEYVTKVDDTDVHFDPRLK